MGSNLEKVLLAQGVLGVPSVELEYLLDRVIALHVQRQRFGAQVPGHALRAGGSGQRACVLVDPVRVQVSGQTGEVQGSGRGVGARGGDVVEVGEHRVEEREGVAELRELEEEAEDGDVGG